MQLDVRTISGGWFSSFPPLCKKLGRCKMITGIDLNEVMDYVCKKDKKDPTIWKLGPIPSSLLAALTTGSAKGDQIQLMISIVQVGLKGWSNFKIKDILVEYCAEEIDLHGKRSGLSINIIDTIPLNIIIEIGTEIIRINRISEDEVKN